jgi:phosphoribosylformylglycinamidine synthase
VTGGNVSLYNETRREDGSLQPIHPTPVIGMVGVVEDIAKVTGLGWCQPGDAVVLLGVKPDADQDDRIGLSGSSYQQLTLGTITGRPPRIDFDLERRVQLLVRQAIANGLIASAHDSSDGGLAVALAECSIASGFGVELNLSPGTTSAARLLFAEGGARVVVSVKAAHLTRWTTMLAANPEVSATVLGAVASHGHFQLSFGAGNTIDLPLEQLQQVYAEALPRRLA